ncbi:(S)-mandelate dehydrogenase [Paraburkholderia caballeronis]|uniref:alpha-hydroxy acid oxidase n=1 Tax=Paraburkholderia caballeronis TaxID=416943 RepID=UPI0010658913|nr:alpha-hydroxy acid oxidase [Paraburkholderia caballeronis]TDV37829.1 (S)-mandelate dehydrogenase [Paraburkholderia caballeronis]
MWPTSRTHYAGRRVERAVAVEDLRRAAHRRLPAFVAEYLEGGAEREVTLARNRDAFSQRTLAPRALVDVSAVDLSTTLFGQTLPLPLVVAPTGLNGLLTDQGDLRLAAAASQAGVPFAQSMVSMATIDAVAARLDTPHWMQLYVLRDRDFVLHLIDRALAAHCSALVLTVDGPVYGNREWDRRHYVRPAVLGWPSRIETLAHPRWLADIWRRGRGPRFVNVEAFTGTRMSAPQTAHWLRERMDASLNWNDLAWLRERWPRLLIVKGLLAADDVRRAIDAGVDGVVLSNHGGRQLDLVGSPLDLLPEVASFAKGRIALLMDGGIRRGSDIAQALALGADAVLVGRAALYGLAAAGEDGAARALAILADELARTMALLGRPSVNALDETIFACEAEPRPATTNGRRSVRVA